MRRLCGDCRWRTREFVPRSSRCSRRFVRFDNRRSGRAPDPGCLYRKRRCSMRNLHARNDYGRHSFAFPRTAPDHRSDSRRARRQFVPLHRLRKDHRGYREGGADSMRAFVPDYDAVCASDVPTALDLLAFGEGWRPIAGGTDLMVLFNAGKLPYSRLFSIRAIAALRTIEIVSGEIVLGAAVTYTQIRQDSTLRAEFPLLPAAASWTGGIANQNRGTLGGNIVTASPAADSAPALLAYDADLSLLSLRGERTLPYREFHTGYKQMRLGPDELLYKIHL